MLTPLDATADPFSALLGTGRGGGLAARREDTVIRVRALVLEALDQQPAQRLVKNIDAAHRWLTVCVEVEDPRRCRLVRSFAERQRAVRYLRDPALGLAGEYLIDLEADDLHHCARQMPGGSYGELRTFSARLFGR